MRRNNNTTLSWIIVVLGLLLLAGLTWGNLNYARANPGANDFLPRWMGTRALIEEGLSPYSDEVAERIQTVAYGRPARAGEDQMRFAYPLYSVYLFMPFALIKDFDLARAAWMTAQETALLLTTFLCLTLYRWKPKRAVLVLLFLFSLLWYHGLQALVNGNAIILVTLMITGGLLAMREGSDELAGVLFALSTIRPQVVVLFLAFIVVWCFGQRRWRVIGWLAASLFLLVSTAALIFPDWIIQNLRDIVSYPGYTPAGSPGTIFAALWPSFGERLGWVLTSLLALVTLVEWRAARGARPPHFLWAAGLTLTVSQWIGIQTDPGNFVVLFPPLLMALALIDEHWKRRGSSIVLFILLLVLALLWAVFLGTFEHGNRPMQSPAMFFLMPAILFLLLYWVRWWAVRPPGPWLDQFEKP